jgi:hypothetical protein
MSNYTHSYSEYVNHILNKSPSKNTYTFPKADRFPPLRSEDVSFEETVFSHRGGVNYDNR